MSRRRSLVAVAVVVALTACDAPRGAATATPSAGVGPSPSATVATSVVASVPPDGSVRPEPRDRVLPSRDVTTDTRYVAVDGRPGLRVELIVDQHGVMSTQPGTNGDGWIAPTARDVPLGESAMGGVEFCLTSAGVALGEFREGEFPRMRHGALTLGASRPGVVQATTHGGFGDVTCSARLDAKTFYKEGWSFAEATGVVDKPVTTQFPVSIGQVTIVYRGRLCEDTGTHDISIRTPRGGLRLLDVLTAQLFEQDVDGDGTTELYVVSTHFCQSWIRVLRVSKTAP